MISRHPAKTRASAPRNKILIVCSHFWPSLGGLESSMGQLSGELVAAGYDVTVMTLMYPGRNADMRGGVRIASVEQPQFSEAIRAAVASGQYSVCILVQDPLGAIVWSVEGLTPPPGTRVFIQPIINEDGYARWKDNADFSARLTRILKDAAHALVMTKSGPDTRFMRDAGIDHVYLPNASVQTAPAGDFRAQFGIAPDRFLILHVANLYWVKNHIGLIDALPDMPASWQMVMIGTGHPDSDCAQAVNAKLATRPEIMLIPGLPPEWVAAAMHAADVVVLASHGEGSPITILEAMSHHTPWLATPQCGAANDHLGGIICPVADFKSYLTVLAGHADLRERLGQVSYAHWSECYAWPVAIQGWTDLITHGRLQRAFEPSAALAGANRALRCEIEAARAASISSLSAPRPPADAPLVSVIVLGGASAQSLEQRLRGVCAQTYAAVEIIVVNDGGAALEHCVQPFKAARNITYLAHDAARGKAAARNAGLRLARGAYVGFLDEDDAFLPEHLALLVAALGAGACRLAYGRTEYLVGTPAGESAPVRPFADIDYSRSLLMVGNFIPSPSWLCARSLFEEAGDFNEAPGTLTDWEWLLRAAEKSEFLCVQSVTATVRQRGHVEATRAQFEQVYAMHPVSVPELALARRQHLERQFPGGAGPADMADAAMAEAREATLGIGELITQAENLTQAGRLDLAVTLYRTWLAHTQSPLRYAAQYNLGTVLETAGDYEQAEHAYRGTLAHNPAFAPARFRLAAQLERRGHTDEALAHWRWISLPENGVAASDHQLYEASVSKLQTMQP